MPEHPSDIDTSVLDKLIEIRKRQNLLQEFCTPLAEVSKPPAAPEETPKVPAVLHALLVH